MSLWMLGSILLVIFVCGTNFEEFFTPKEVSSDCVAIPALKYFGITSFSLDFLVLILPIPKASIDCQESPPFRLTNLFAFRS